MCLDECGTCMLVREENASPANCEYDNASSQSDVVFQLPTAQSFIFWSSILFHNKLMNKDIFLVSYDYSKRAIASLKAKYVAAKNSRAI